MTTEWKDITDPEELFRLKREGWEIEFKNTYEEKWFEWNGIEWESRWKFRARPAQPKMKKVKLLAWLDADQLFWLRETSTSKFPAVRVPAEDKIIEVME